MRKPAFILFVPSYGSGGTGEFVRSVSLAQAVAQRWPQARIEFLLPGGAGTRQDAPFPKTCHQGPRSSKAQFNNEHIARLQPDLVIFDTGLHSKTLRLCSRLGILTAFVSDRGEICRRAFKLDRLRLLDEHWHQREHCGLPIFTSTQRFLSIFGKTARRTFDTYIASEPYEDALPQEFTACLSKPFVLLAPGGGGYQIGGQPVSEIYLSAAEQIAAETGLECLTLLGPLYEGSARGTRTLTTKTVSPSQFIDLMRCARLLVCNGGHSLTQAIACGVVCIAAPLGGGDQEGRIAAYKAVGLVQGCAPTAAAIVEATLALLDPETYRRQRMRVVAEKMVNGIPLMCDSIARLLPNLGQALESRNN
ncbi:MAG: hypothetical protein JWR16_3639 [Nevskia sp.]|nr:hypothetical protein [Nevskia sp.]